MYGAISILFCTTVYLLVRLISLRKAAKELGEEFASRIAADSNAIIGISSRDRYLLFLTDHINQQLKELRTKRHHFEQGDLELKNAVTNISHDLRTPLTAICGYLELLEKEELGETAKRYLSNIKNRTEALKVLTEELLCYSVNTSVKELDLQPSDIKRTLEESLISFYGVMRQNGIEPNIELPENPVYRNLDSGAAARILSNIISNVIKYSDGDFHVKMEDNGTIIFSNLASHLDTVSVGQLFDRFFTVNNSRNSTGLGLSIAKLLTERMGGTILADYKDNRLFITLYFPDNSNIAISNHKQQ